MVAVARDGVDAEQNRVTKSQLRNSKANWTLEELSWKLLPPGNNELGEAISHIANIAYVAIES